ncbi:MAG: LCP family protein, partial [Lachnospiraceae bacterium]|nr:LCP family protein [Lachnospiraceae bacterium]
AQSGQRPAQSGQRPAQNGQRPVQSGQRPAQNVRRPAQSGQRPMQEGQRPVQHAQRPVQEGQRPVQNVRRPAQSGQRPAQGSQRTSAAPRRTTPEEARRRIAAGPEYAPRTRAEGGTAGDEMSARRSGRGVPAQQRVRTHASGTAADSDRRVREDVLSLEGRNSGRSSRGESVRGGGSRSGNGSGGHGGRGNGGNGGRGNGGNGRFDGPDHRKRDGSPIGICKALAIELFAVVAAAAVFFIITIVRSRMLNTKFTILVIALCAVVCAVVALLGWTHAYKQNITKGKQRAAFIASVAVSVLFTIFFIIGGVYILKTVSTIRNVGGVTTEISNYHVYVLDDDPAERLEDAAGYTFGILETQDRENVDQIVDQIEEELGSQITVAEYPGLTGIADAMNSHEIGATILGETFIDMFENFEGYETFADGLRSIWTGTIETEIETVPEQLNNIVTIYISGSDTRESTLPTRSLSDVNLIMRMNLDTHQILIISTPRDYYVPTSVSGGMRDKLTHAGAYGVQCSMDTLSMLYGIDIDYYVRLNFVGFVDIIDALGGIDVWSDNTFTTGNMIGYTIWEGWNHMDGATALAYSRERYAFADGDNQRGRDQMEVLKGIIRACTSPQILTSYMDVLDSVDGCFETSIPYSVMADLVRFQQDYGGEWEMITYSVYGEGASQPTFSSQSYAFVFIPDETTVATASDLLNRMAAGEVISDPNAEPSAGQ